MLIRTIALLPFCLALTAQELPKLLVDPNVDQTKIDIQGLWAREVYAREVRLAGQKNLPQTITVKLSDWALCCGSDMQNPVISFSQYPLDKNNVSDGTYAGLSHELGHALTFNLVDGSMEFTEGFAEAMHCFVYQRIYEADPSTHPCFFGFFQDAINNLDANAGAGSDNFYMQPVYPYNSAAGPLQLVLRSEEDFRAVTAAYESAGGHPVFASLARITDEALNRRLVGGVSIPTFLNRIVASYSKGRDGTFFGFTPNGQVESFQQWPTGTVINPNWIEFRYFERKAGVVKYLPATVDWWINDAFGNIVVPKTTIQIGDNSDASNLQTYFLKDVCYPPQGGSQALCSLPDGGYKLTACVGTLCDYAFFGRYNRDPKWTYKSIFVITNGPRFGDLKADESLSFSSEDVEVMPGLVRFRNTASDPSVTAWGNTVGFAYHRDFSPVYLLTMRDSPKLLSLTDPATFQPLNEVAGGSIVTLFAWGATHNDPQLITGETLPSASCPGPRGATKVVFVEDSGTEHPAPQFYCSFSQINVQVPMELVPGARYSVQIDLNGARSNSWPVTAVETTPRIFLIDPAAKLGAVEFAFGPKFGQLVTPANPALPGDYLAIYASGLGSVTPPPAANGARAQANPLSVADLPTSVLAGDGIWPTVFSGLVPGFVGLFQINTQVPENAPRRHLAPQAVLRRKRK